MKCQKCGADLIAGLEICPKCGQEVKMETISPQSPQIIIDKNNDEKILEINESLTEEQSKIINSGSWGATLGIFYLIGMQSWVWLLIVLGVGVVSSFLAGIPSLVMMIYLIVKGKDIAWKTRRWKSFDEFLMVQRTWDFWGKILFGFQMLAIVGLMVAMILVGLGGARTKASDAKTKSDMNSIVRALEIYKNENKQCPDKLANLSTKYINPLPQKIDGSAYSYRVLTGKCIVSAKLNEQNDTVLTNDAIPGNDTYDLSTQ